MDALLSIVADTLHKVVPEVFGLLSGYHLGDNRHVQALFVGDAGRGEVYVDLVLLIFRFCCYVPG